MTERFTPENDNRQLTSAEQAIEDEVQEQLATIDPKLEHHARWLAIINLASGIRAEGKPDVADALVIAASREQEAFQKTAIEEKEDDE